MKRSGGNGEDFGRMGKERGFWEKKGKPICGNRVGIVIGTKRGISVFHVINRMDR